MEKVASAAGLSSVSAALVQAALHGLGLVYRINGHTERFLEEGRPVRVLADWSPRLPGLVPYCPDRRRTPAKPRVFIDFLRNGSAGATPATEGAVAGVDRPPATRPGSRSPP